MNGAKIIGVLVVIGIGVGFAIWRMKANDATDERLVQTWMACQEIVAKCPSYQKNEAFFEANDEAANQRALAASYTPSGRRRAANFDEAKYCSVYFKHLIDDATRANKPDLATELRQAQIDAERALGLK